MTKLVIRTCAAIAAAAFAVPAAPATFLNAPSHAGGLVSDRNTFIVTAFECDEPSQLVRLTWWGGYHAPGGETAPDKFVVRIFEKKVGAAPRLIAAYNNIAVTRTATAEWVNPPDDTGFEGRPEFEYSFELPAPVVLESARYGVSIVNTASGTAGGPGQWIWEQGSASTGFTLERSRGSAIHGPWISHQTGVALAFELLPL